MFGDTIIIVHLLKQAKDMELLHYLLDFLVVLSKVEGNLEQLLDREFVELMLQFISYSHLHPDTIGNALARATNKQLLIEDGSLSGSNPPNNSNNSNETETTETNNHNGFQLMMHVLQPGSLLLPTHQFHLQNTSNLDHIASLNLLN